MAKADQVIQHREESSNDNIAHTCVPQQQQRKDIDYHSEQQSVDALSIVFGMTEFEMLMNTQNTPYSSQPVPIGLKLLQDRSANLIEAQDYNECSEATSKVVSQWKFLLLEVAKEHCNPTWQLEMNNNDGRMENENIV